MGSTFASTASTTAGMLRSHIHRTYSCSLTILLSYSLTVTNSLLLTTSFSPTLSAFLFIYALALTLSRTPLYSTVHKLQHTEHTVCVHICVCASATVYSSLIRPLHPSLSPSLSPSIVHHFYFYPSSHSWSTKNTNPLDNINQFLCELIPVYRHESCSYPSTELQSSKTRICWKNRTHYFR